MTPTRPITTTVRQVIDHLAIADPEAAARMRVHVQNRLPRAVLADLEPAVEEVIEALATEIDYGRRLAEGMGRMLAAGQAQNLDRYRQLVKSAAERGPTLAALFARHLIPVLISADASLADRFEATTRIMLKKGTYTLKAPLETLSALIENSALDCANAFFDLLETTYGLELSYNRSLYLTHTLPRAVKGFSAVRRLWQIRGLTRIIAVDERLADDYLKGLGAGLGLLSQSALDRFLDGTIQRHRKDPMAAARHLGLETRRAREQCRDLQIAVPLSAVRADLERYLLARTGLPVAVCPLSDHPSGPCRDNAREALIRCDGRTIYLPTEMDLLDRRSDNTALYKLLVRMEAGAIEFGTYDLDLKKALDGAPSAPAAESADTRAAPSDIDRFIRMFDRPRLALDLFVVFEHGRIAAKVRRHYPGLSRRLTAALTDSRLLANTADHPGGTLYPLYRHVMVGQGSSPSLAAKLQGMADHFFRFIATSDDSVETSARLTLRYYPLLAGRTDSPFRPLVLPFGRRLEPAFFGPFHANHDHLAAEIQAGIERCGLRAYRSEIRHLLVRRNGQASAADIRRLIFKPAHQAGPVIDQCGLDWFSLLGNQDPKTLANGLDNHDAYRYREWDRCLRDYLPDRVRVVERDIHGSDGAFYQQTLARFIGLARRIRYAFELMRPEEMTILRQWRDGDVFDYRALLDYALDKKAGLMPSDRLFIKRMKQERDVAALLLVDLSRSTANMVDDRGTRVLDVEKQAIVLLCEALTVVGDRFAIAGFSGTGPLGVDYFSIKAMDAPLDDVVKGRIGAMAPQRSTRMGAAIRHAASRLSGVQARVRLIIVLGDGFPNDLEYKGAYAVEDTRRAVMEARADAIHVKAITVNTVDNSQLDRLYGKSHHTLIGNLRDLPDKLVRVYSALTRH